MVMTLKSILLSVQVSMNDRVCRVRRAACIVGFVL